MKQVGISIIVPVYKAEKYLDRCVQSIQGQTFSDWELLLVDDGSPDNSGKLCDQYAVSDSRIRVFHKQNGGVASAREMGIQNATGKYSIHVDPDDWIDEGTLSALFEKAEAENLDVVICDFLLEYRDHQEIDKQEPKELSSDACLCQLLSQELHGSLCNKLIRTELYKKYDLHFPLDMICWEDLYICCNIFMHDVRIGYVSKPFYHYDFFTNDNSMVRKTNMKGLVAQMNCIKLLSAELSGDEIDFLHEMKWLVLVTAFRMHLLPEVKIRNIYPEINDLYVAKYGNDWSRTIYYGLCLVLIGDTYKIAEIKMKYVKFYLRVKNRLLHILAIS